ncbi:MAG: hypothetical protein L6R41_007958, partial [Letrouitia leprolyta]
ILNNGSLTFNHSLGDFTTQLFEDHKAWVSNDWKDGQWKVLDYACGTDLVSQALAPHVAQIIGIDKSKEMVSIYSENVKRQAHPAYTMQADASNFILQSEVNSDAWLTSSESEIQNHLIQSPEAIINRLNENGTLLIFEIQKHTNQTGPEVQGLIDSYKMTGYHSDDFVQALEAIGLEEIEVLDNVRFNW